MAEPNLFDLRRRSGEFASEHLQECAAELLEWGETAVLPNGKIRELADMCRKWSNAQQALQLAERLVVDAALRKIAGEKFSSCD